MTTFEGSIEEALKRMVQEGVLTQKEVNRILNPKGIIGFDRITDAEWKKSGEQLYALQANALDLNDLIDPAALMRFSPMIEFFYQKLTGKQLSNEAIMENQEVIHQVMALLTYTMVQGILIGHDRKGGCGCGS